MLWQLADRKGFLLFHGCKITGIILTNKFLSSGIHSLWKTTSGKMSASYGTWKPLCSAARELHFPAFSPTWPCVPVKWPSIHDPPHSSLSSRHSSVVMKWSSSPSYRTTVQTRKQWRASWGTYGTLLSSSLLSCTSANGKHYFCAILLANWDWDGNVWGTRKK